MKTVEQHFEQMKAEILADMASGLVPKTVASFSELHDYVDANEYGGFCNDAQFDEMVTQYGGRNEHDGMPQGMVDHINKCQNAVSTWLKVRSLITPSRVAA